jgi:hypothetical protein
MAIVEVGEGRVEALERVLSYLVAERQRMRSDGADRATLEANRRAIVAMQSRLAHALVDTHSSSAKEQRAAAPDQEETTAH